MKYIVLWVTLITGVLLWAVIPSTSTEETHVRMFCAYGRVFIEFDEKYNSWGTLWLDNDGRPVSCDDARPLRGKIGSQYTI